MKKLLALCLFALVGLFFSAGAQSAEVKKEKLNVTQSGAVMASQSSEFWLQNKIENQISAHQMVRDVERRSDVRLNYIPNDFAPTVAIPIAALRPSLRRSSQGTYGNPIQVSLVPSVYPNSWNYFNEGYRNKPLESPFTLASAK